MTVIFKKHMISEVYITILGLFTTMPANNPGGIIDFTIIDSQCSLLKEYTLAAAKQMSIVVNEWIRNTVGIGSHT